MPDQDQFTKSTKKSRDAAASIQSALEGCSFDEARIAKFLDDLVQQSGGVSAMPAILTLLEEFRRDPLFAKCDQTNRCRKLEEVVRRNQRSELEGVGALNLPFNEAQVGSQNTRAMHPGTLVRMEKILGRVLETPMKLDLPFFFKTKGELCEDAGPSVKDLAKITMSCDEGETRKADPTEHCGCCTSCLFRRAALFHALSSQDPTNYLLQRKNASYFRDAFTNQVHQLLRACESYQSLLELDPNISHVEDYWKVRGIHIEKIKEDTRMLFERYAKQAQRFLTEVPPP